MKKIKDLKLIKKIKGLVQAVRQFFQNSFEGTQCGVIVASVLVTACVAMGFFHMYFPVLPFPVCFLITAVLVVLAGELLGILILLLFGIKKRSRIYGLLQFLIWMICALAGTQASHVLLCAFFAFALTFIICLFGRCLWAVIRRKKHTVLVIVCLVLSFAGTVATIVFLAGEGFDDGYINEYLTMAENADRSAENKLSFGTEQGGYPVGTLTYGVASARDISSRTYNLSVYAEQDGIDKFNRDEILGYGLAEAPLDGKIWYPAGESGCPVLFIIHGNHAYEVDSYLGYEYLGEYLASYGYVVISVNENVCNGLSNENDARAVLLLENMKYILELNKDESSLLYGKIDEDNIAVAGHSRGGEAVCEAYLFNDYESYPENGNVRFSYHFNIRSILAIAPCMDQYQPAQRVVELEDVNYFIIHGASDQDVSVAMGQKQYYNVTFSGIGSYIKGMLYVSGANHGQFNSEWGNYDSEYPFSMFLNVADFIEEEEQQNILKLFAKTFLDVTLKDDRTNEELLKDCQSYGADLPKTIYQQLYQSSDFVCLADFEQDSALYTASVLNGRIETSNLHIWTERRSAYGLTSANENHVMLIGWEDAENKGVPEIRLTFPKQDITGKAVVFDLADASEDCFGNLLDGIVTVQDKAGNTASVRISDEIVVYPTLPVRLNKLDYMFGIYEYKHPFQTISIPADAFVSNNIKLDTESIVKLSITFDYAENGSIWLDNVGIDL